MVKLLIAYTAAGCTQSGGLRCNSVSLFAAEYIKEAVAEDKAENYEKAFEAYMNGLEYFKTHLKYEKNPRSKEAITVKASSCKAHYITVVHHIMQKYKPVMFAV